MNSIFYELARSLKPSATAHNLLKNRTSKEKEEWGVKKVFEIFSAYEAVSEFEIRIMTKKGIDR